ncbi:MAG: hypothetical protein H6882_13190 [Rhodobiaceae bacterium]|nr:hypothetical protein [Rhodobiaceae bacterium]
MPTTSDAEQTGIMELNPKVLFSTIVAEEDDAGVKRFAALARNSAFGCTSGRWQSG